MRNVLKRISGRWAQFTEEAAGLVAGFQLLIVNLAYIQQRVPKTHRIVLVLDSWREALILRLLWVLRILPHYRIWVIRRSSQLAARVKGDFDGEPLLIVTSRAFTKHYQLLVELRRQQRLIVL